MADKSAEEERKIRLAMALRANLRRRKAQTRAVDGGRADIPASDRSDS